jgi:GDP-L-fucose synthase
MKKKFKETIINIGTGRDYSIKEYAKIILNLILPNEKIKIKYDKSKPNGTPRKVMDISLAKKYGWQSQMKLNDAVYHTYKSYIKNLN